MFISPFPVWATPKNANVSSCAMFVTSLDFWTSDGEFGHPLVVFRGFIAHPTPIFHLCQIVQQNSCDDIHMILRIWGPSTFPSARMAPSNRFVSHENLTKLRQIVFPRVFLSPSLSFEIRPLSSCLDVELIFHCSSFFPLNLLNVFLVLCDDPFNFYAKRIVVRSLKPYTRKKV